MDPPLVNEFSFSAANPCSYSLAEIWLYPINGAEVASRMGNLGHGFGESSGHRDGSMEESTVTERSGGGCGRKRRDLSSEDESSKIVSTTTDTNDSIESNSNRMKISGSKNERGDSKAEAEGSSAAGNKSKDYIHVRARRSQATDSHSLAERARREKISERMKILQDLVPGCNKDLKMKKVIQKLRLKEVLQLLTSQKITFVSEQEGAKLPIAIV